MSQASLLEDEPPLRRVPTPPWDLASPLAEQVHISRRPFLPYKSNAVEPNPCDMPSKCPTRPGRGVTEEQCRPFPLPTLKPLQPFGSSAHHDTALPSLRSVFGLQPISPVPSPTVLMPSPGGEVEQPASAADESPVVLHDEIQVDEPNEPNPSSPIFCDETDDACAAPPERVGRRGKSKRLLTVKELHKATNGQAEYVIDEGTGKRLILCMCGTKIGRFYDYPRHLLRHGLDEFELIKKGLMTRAESTNVELLIAQKRIGYPWICQLCHPGKTFDVEDLTVDSTFSAHYWRKLMMARDDILNRHISKRHASPQQKRLLKRKAQDSDEEVSHPPSKQTQKRMRLNYPRKTACRC